MERKEILKRVQAKLREVKGTSPINPNFISWKGFTERAIAKLFGDPSIELKQFNQIKFHSPDISLTKELEFAMPHIQYFKTGIETVEKMLIDLIETSDYYSDLNRSINETFETIPKAVSSKLIIKKINWMGTQKELGELFVELKRKGWIEEHFADTIKCSFTNSHSIEQVLKPSRQKKDKNLKALYDGLYEGIYTERYKPKFDFIKPNETVSNQP